MSNNPIQKDFNALASLCAVQEKDYRVKAKEFKKADLEFWIVAAIPVMALLALGVGWFFS